MNASELIHQLRLDLWNITYSRYLGQELFSWQWWVLVVLLVILYTVWWRLVDKSRLTEILLMGSFVSVMGAVIDVWGVTTAHWQYNIRLLPLLPAPFPFDFTAVPILFMLGHQYCQTWSGYFAWSAASAALFSFVVGPVLQAAGVNSFYNWPFAYYFIIIMGEAMIARAAILLTQRAEAGRTEAVYPGYFAPLAQPAAKRLPDDADEDGKEE